MKELERRDGIHSILFISILCYMVFITIYFVGDHIAITNAAWNMVSDFLRRMTGIIDLYRIVVFAGMVLAAATAIVARKQWKNRDFLFLCCFFAVMLISAFLNRDLGFSENVLSSIKFIEMIVLFYLLYPVVSGRQWEFLMKRVIFFASVILNIGTVTSLIFYLINYKGYYNFIDGHVSRQGIMDGRLFGMFRDPNYAAYECLLILVGLTWICRRVNNKFINLYVRITVAVNIAYIILSGSRTAMVITFVLVVLYHTAAYIRMTELSGWKNAVMQIGKKIVMTMIVLGLIYVGVLFLFKGLGVLIVPDRNTETELMREDISAENISNGRLEIWKQYLSFYVHRPVFGYSIDGVSRYAKVADPENLIVQKHYNAHNGYIGLLSYTGLTGFVALAGFFVCIIAAAVRLIKSREDHGRPLLTDTFFLAVCFICMNMVYSMFYLGFFSSLQYETILLWSSLGYVNQKLTT